MNILLPTKRVLGVDGGGSKTVAWIANVLPGPGLGELEIVGRGNAGPSNPRSVGFETAFANLTVAIDMASQQLPPNASVTPKLDVACLSLAGAGRPQEQSRVRQWSDELGIARRTIVIDDVEPLRLAAMFEHGKISASAHASWRKSITLVSGTGSIARGTDLTKPSQVRCGGWGYLLGDEGSGFAIGMSGLRTVCQAHDRGHALTEFQRALLKQLGLNEPTELVSAVYQSPLPRSQIAQLSKIVLAYANHDEQASQIANDAIQAMAQLVETIARRLGHAHGDYALALSGGILSNNPSMVSSLLRELQLRELAPCAYHLVREPIYGALAMAADLSNSQSGHPEHPDPF